VPLLRLGLVSTRVLHRRRGLFGFVGEAAFAFGDVRQFGRVLLQRLDAAAFVNHLLAFVEELFQVHLDPSLGATASELSATGRGALHSSPMSTLAAKNAALCASPAVVVVAITGVVTEAVLVKSTVVV
jgi:hypothetical protein